MFCLAAVLALGVAVPAYAKDKLDTPTSVTFGEDGAMWDEVEVDNDKTVKYEIRLYKAKEKVSSKTTKELECTFEDQIAKKGTGTYYVQVRATCSGYTTSDWSEKSKGFYVNSELLSDYKSSSSSSDSPSTSSSSTGSSSTGGPGFSMASKTTGWVQDNIGWWYRHADGGYGVNAWEMIDGSWYYFGSNGYMVTGWLSVNGAQYYLSASGAMVTGTQNIDGMTCQFDANGVRIQ